MFKLALGAGHGLATSGKRCLKSLDPKETREWYLNDRICDYIEQELKKYENISILRLDDSDDGADDVALEVRTNAANKWGADFYLSIHHNAGLNGAAGGGIEAFSLTEKGEGALWRDKLYAELVKETGLKGNRADGTKTANFWVLRKTNMPAVLLELGFMDSPTDVPIILTDSYAKKCAKAIVNVIVNQKQLKKKTIMKEDEENMDVATFTNLYRQMRKTFQDNDASEWSEEAREWAVKKNLVQGSTAGAFNGMWEDTLTRE